MEDSRPEQPLTFPRRQNLTPCLQMNCGHSSIALVGFPNPQGTCPLSSLAPDQVVRQVLHIARAGHQVRPVLRVLSAMSRLGSRPGCLQLNLVVTSTHYTPGLSLQASRVLSGFLALGFLSGASRPAGRYCKSLRKIIESDLLAKSMAIIGIP